VNQLELPFELLPGKAAFWREKHTLIVSDVHIGKAAHFRKAGVAIPTDVNRENLWRLTALLLDHRPQRVLILGDLVHSHHNREWDDFIDMRRNYSSCAFTLIKGNHDVLPETAYTSESILIHPSLKEDHLKFVHEPATDGAATEGELEVCGHLHPAIKLRGTARQSLRLPCFWLSPIRLVMPAFGAFTGMHAVQPSAHDRVFAIAGDRVVEV
jgi:DNA ligase-associated metallophosphoesterase